MTDAKTRVLNEREVEQKINRIAHEIYEYNYDQEKLILVGIANRGYLLAEKIHAKLTAISPLNIQLVKLVLDKENPMQNPVELNLTKADTAGKVVLLVDDVLNTGQTLIYGARHLLDFPLAMLKTVVLVNRRHRKFPIRADYMGLSLSTTMQEHISVEFTATGAVVYLE